MKVLGCGVLASNPERAFRFVIDSGCAQAMTIGFLSQEEMRAATEALGLRTVTSRQLTHHHYIIVARK